MRLIEWIETGVQRMRAKNAAQRERIFRKRYPPELEIKPPAHGSRSKAGR